MNPATLNEICDFQFSSVSQHSHFLRYIQNILMEKTPPVDSVIDGLRACLVFAQSFEFTLT